MKITLSWRSKHHCVLLHNRLGSNIILGKLKGFAMKIAHFWSYTNHCVLLHKRVGSKIIPGKLWFCCENHPLLKFWKPLRFITQKTRVKNNSPETEWFYYEILPFEALKTIAFDYTRDSGQKWFPGNSMVLLWKSSSFEALETVAFYYTKDSGQKQFPGNLMVLLWTSPSFEALKTIAFYCTKDSGQK